jgi:hypothetical protein
LLLPSSDSHRHDVSRHENHYLGLHKNSGVAMFLLSKGALIIFNKL